MTATLTPSPDATAQALLLEEHLRRLRLPVLLARYPAQCYGSCHQPQSGLRWGQATTPS